MKLHNTHKLSSKTFHEKRKASISEVLIMQNLLSNLSGSNRRAVRPLNWYRSAKRLASGIDAVERKTCLHRVNINTLTLSFSSSSSSLPSFPCFHSSSNSFSRSSYRRYSSSSYISSDTPRTSLPIYYNDVFVVQLPEQHKFPMEKYRVMREGLQNEFAKLPHVKFIQSPLATRNELKTTHCSDYIDRFLTNKLTYNEMRRIGFPYNDMFVLRTLSSVGGTVAATYAVLGIENAGAPAADWWLGLDTTTTSDDNHAFYNGLSSSVTVNDSFAKDLFDKPLSAAHTAGGTHHAFYDYGEGFCVFNDIAVAANLALNYVRAVAKIRPVISNQAFNILIVDLDVHQGNGTATLFDTRFSHVRELEKDFSRSNSGSNSSDSNSDAANNSKSLLNKSYSYTKKYQTPTSDFANIAGQQQQREGYQKEVLRSQLSPDNRHHVFTCSFHCKSNYFSAVQMSDFDVELPPNMNDDEYTNTIETHLKEIFYRVQPNLVYYQAGVDICAGDRLGRLNVSRDAAKARNNIVYNLSRAFNCKIVATLGGGYPRDLNPESESFKSIIEAHKDVYRSLVSGS